jgi:hypothetical protein
MRVWLWQFEANFKNLEFTVNWILYTRLIFTRLWRKVTDDVSGEHPGAIPGWRGIL